MMSNKKKQTIGNKVARRITYGMATWSFIVFILVACITEITLNHYGIVNFDPTMLVLNTILSLWAAVQGSIIMINQNQADADRDALLKKILEMEKKIEKLLKQRGGK